MNRNNPQPRERIRWRRTSLRILESKPLSIGAGALLALAAGLIAMTGGGWADHRFAEIAASLLSFVSLALSLYFFVAVGKGALTPWSLVFYATMVFLYFPAVLSGWSFSPSPYEVRVMFAGFMALIALWLFAKHARETSALELERLCDHARTLQGPWVVIGLGASVLFVLLSRYVPMMYHFWAGGLAGTVLLFILLGSVAFRDRNHVLGLGHWAIAGALAVGWYVYIFTGVFGGFGRLNVAAILLACAVVHLYIFPWRPAKIAVAVLTPLGLLWGGIIEQSRERSTADIGAQVSNVIQGEGIRSVLAPFREWANMLQSLDAGPWFKWWEWFDQLIASVLYFVPREWWPAKPEGFGRLMVYHLKPFGASPDHSMAASVFGEGTAYFGVLGVLFAIGLLVVVIACLRLLHTLSGRLPATFSVLAFILAIWGTAQMLSMVWVGLFTYSVRTVSMAFGLVVPFAALHAYHVVRGGRRGAETGR